MRARGLIAAAAGAGAAAGLALACNALLGNGNPVLDVVDAREADTSVAHNDDGGDTSLDSALDADTSLEDASDDACTADASSDPLNCGACGHSCLGGACEAGACLPTRIVNMQPTPNAIVADPGPSGSVFWCDFHTGGVRSVDKQTLVTTTINADNPAGPITASIAVAGSTVFWTTPDNGQGGTIAWAERDGGSPGSISREGWLAPTPIATDGTRVIWGNRYSKDVWSLDIGTKVPTELGAYDAAAPGPDLLAVAVNPVQEVVFFADGVHLYRVGVDGTDDGHTAGVGGSNGPVLVDDGFVYWLAGSLTNGASIVRERTLGGCVSAQCPQSIVFGGVLNSVTWLAADDTFLYIADNSAGKLYRARKDGSAPGSLDTLVVAPGIAQVAVDTVAIYFDVQGDDGAEAGFDGFILAPREVG